MSWKAKCWKAGCWMLENWMLESISLCLCVELFQLWWLNTKNVAEDRTTADTNIQLFIHANFSAWIKEIIKFITCVHDRIILFSQSHCQIVCSYKCWFKNVFLKEKNCINPKWFIKFQGRSYINYLFFRKTRILNLLTCTTFILLSLHVFSVFFVTRCMATYIQIKLKCMYIVHIAGKLIFNSTINWKWTLVAILVCTFFMYIKLLYNKFNIHVCC